MIGQIFTRNLNERPKEFGSSKRLLRADLPPPRSQVDSAYNPTYFRAPRFPKDEEIEGVIQKYINLDVDSKNFDSSSLNQSVHFRRTSTNEKRYLNNINRTCMSSSKRVRSSFNQLNDKLTPS